MNKEIPISKEDAEADEKFFKDIDMYALPQVNGLRDCLQKEGYVLVGSFDLKIRFPTGFEATHGLTEDIEVTVGYDPMAHDPSYLKVRYYYKKMEIKPKAYYLRPTEYHAVSSLRILKEAVKQDTWEPDIMKIEKGEEV